MKPFTRPLLSLSGVKVSTCAILLPGIFDYSVDHRERCLTPAQRSAELLYLTTNYIFPLIVLRPLRRFAIATSSSLRNLRF